MDEKIQKIIVLIEESELDRTVKDILIRDLKADGLTDFLREQIRAYCLEGIKRASRQIEEAKKVLDEHDDRVTQNPA